MDTKVGTSGNDTFDGGVVNTFSAFDNLDGGAGTDTLTVQDSTGVIPGGAVVKNIETINIYTSAAGYVADTTAFTGLTSLTVNDSAQVAGAITLNSSGAVTVTALGATAAGATISVGATTSPTGAVTVAQTLNGTGNTTGGGITVKGGTVVNITENLTQATITATTTAGLTTVTGTAATTGVTVTQSAPVILAAAAGSTETASAAFNAAAMAAGDTMTFAGLTLTATGAVTAAQAAAGFASLLNGATAGNAVANGTWSGILTGWSSGVVGAGPAIIFTSATADKNVTDLTTIVTGAGGVVAAVITETDGVNAVTAAAGITNGNVVITDVNSASLTAAGVITSVNLNNFAAATANSGALATVTLAGKGTSFTQTNGALTTATVTTEQLNLNGVTTTGAVALGSVPTTVNLVSGTATNTLNSLTGSGIATLNISGDKDLVISAHTLKTTTAINSTSTGAVTFTGALLAGQSYAGGAGVDTITLTVGGTKAITTGAGNDVVTYAGVMGTGGSVNAGDGTADTISMTTALAIAATGTNLFAATVSNFEVLSLSDVTGGAAAINMANASTGVNTLSILGVTGGAALTVTNAAANFTLEERGAITFASSVALATDTGGADVVNLTFKANDGFVNTAALTVANVETINITTTDGDALAQTMAITTPITATSATSVVIAGNIGVNLLGGMAHTALTSLDASGLTGTGVFGGLTWLAGALTANATVKGSAAGYNTIDFSASTKVVTYTGGTGADVINFANANTKANIITLGDGLNIVNGGTNANGNNTITGGAGVDTILVGTGNNIISGGAGADLITVGSGANSVSLGLGADTLTLAAANTSSAIFTTISDIGATDIISNGALLVFAGVVGGKMGAALTSGVDDYQTFLNNACSKGAGVVSWFQTGGNTYVVEDINAAVTYTAASDVIVKLTGLVDLTNSTLATGGHTITIV